MSDINISTTKIYNKYLITFLFSFVNAIFNFWFFRIALKDLGEETFYYYAYSRRVISFFSPILMMGIGVGLPRFIGVYASEKKEINALMNSSVLILLVVSIFWVLINFIFNETITNILWGKVSSYSVALNLAVSINLLSISIWGAIHSFYRGKLKVIHAGIVLLISHSILPFIAFSFMNDLNKIYNLVSTILLILSLFFLLSFNIKRKSNRKPTKIVVISLLKYGIGRIPGDLALALLVFLPSFIAASYFNMEYAGIISFAGALVTISSLPASAISFNLLSRSAFLFANDGRVLKKEIKLILAVGLIFCITIYLGLYFFLEKFIEWFLDRSLLKHLDILLDLILAIPPFIIFTLTRSVIDGTKSKPYNSYNIVTSLFIFMVFAMLALKNHSLDLIIFGIIASYFVLALLSLYRIVLIFKR